MDTELLKSFIVLAQTKNFTKAAIKLYRSQSAISLQLAKIENVLGKKLFIRDKRKVVLTSEGEQFLGYAQKIIQMEEKMLLHFQKTPINGEVHFGTPEDLATAYLPTILSNFIENNQGILLNVNCQFTLDLIKGFETKNYDLILIKQDPERPHPKSQEVWREKLVWVCCKEMPLFKLKNEPLSLILAPTPCVYRQRAIHSLDENSIPWRIVYTSPSLAGTLAAVRAKLGISVLPQKMVPKDFQIIKDLPQLQDAQIAILKQDNASDATSELANYVVDHIISDFS